MTIRSLETRTGSPSAVPKSSQPADPLSLLSHHRCDSLRGRLFPQVINELIAGLLPRYSFAGARLALTMLTRYRQAARIDGK